MSEWTLFALLAGAFGAGFVDAVVGGGGLIQVPLLFSLLPGQPPATLFGTNKIASIFGTGTASVQYARRIALDRNLVLIGAGCALFGAWWGARMVSYLDPTIVRPLVLVLLIAVAAYTFRNKNFGTTPAVALGHRQGFSRIIPIALCVGFYDGFLGPGTGSFFIFLLIRFLGMDFLRASATAKILNFATNLAAISFFAFTGAVLWSVGLAMAVANIAGAVTGSTLALRHGAGFVRRIFITVVVALIAKMAYELL
ncbi:TSUP family transporter [Nitrogeniibacter mangrovi]|uniref:Probable membrane transporter protein n=1 Tax=Nitrogeniibacter mangrovi TaxID=2016596 RepID=A0A6C1B7B4_9RHOO|nr:TSUP family transporter [Nitrogeniibacter mangrovi]QID19652.1 TSUP family transporter [Nitrogeniibacter mangrovi]